MELGELDSSSEAGGVAVAQANVKGADVQVQPAAVEPEADAEPEPPVVDAA